MGGNRFCSIAIAVAVLVGGCSAASESSTERSNILLIVADDLGYADLGAFGSDIRTPNIDALAERGVWFTQFHTAPMCGPTRAMLMTGNNNHVAGIGDQDGVPGVFGYEGHLTDRVAPLPGLLREAGYHTYSVGKWHLGSGPDHRPAAVGFERSFNMLHGGAGHYSATGFFEGGTKYSENGEDATWPEGAFSTELFTDTLIGMIESDRAAAGSPSDAQAASSDDESEHRPFFAYAAYTAPHWPLQVPDDWRGRYVGAYDDGYDALRVRNFERLKEADIIPAGSDLPPRNPDITPWDELTPEQKRVEAREMELYAAMVENLDHHIGRLLEYLEGIDELDNTLLVFMSDNGAAGEDFFYDESRSFIEYLQANYDNSYENMGRADSWVSYGPPWAEAGSAPFRLYKSHSTQGGVLAPMIVAGPGVARVAEPNHSFATVMDIAPTLLEVAGAKYPADGSVRPILGESMTEVLAGRAADVHADDYSVVVNHRTMSYLRRGAWKLVSLTDPTDLETFALYNVAEDPGETNDLRESRPDLYADLTALWSAEVERLEIVLLEPQ